MSENTADLLKQVSAELEKASSDFSKKAEAALDEAKKAGSLSSETKAAVDELATKF
ncbi:phage major capsid protein, partial [Pseudomonas aeruginosa]